MTELFSTVLGISFAAGLNTYATVLALGVMHRLQFLTLPDGMDILGSTPVLVAAGVLYAIEFIADKIPIVDTAWDGLHTVVRPIAGALLAYGAVGQVDPEWRVIAGLVGGGIALTSHTAKASTRAAVNVSPEPFSNWFLSLLEDAVSFVVVWLTVSHPIAAIVIVAGLVLIAALVIWKLSNLVRNAFRRPARL